MNTIYRYLTNNCVILLTEIGENKLNCIHCTTPIWARPELYGQGLTYMGKGLNERDTYGQTAVASCFWGCYMLNKCIFHWIEDITRIKKYIWFSIVNCNTSRNKITSAVRDGAFSRVSDHPMNTCTGHTNTFRGIELPSVYFL